MSWKTDLLPASFRGIPFEVLNLSDRGEKSLAVHEYPYRAGAYVEDMGRKARAIPIRAVFWGQGYLARLQELTAALEETGAGELVHPVFGSVQVTVQNFEIAHEAEKPDYATISFDCLESVLDAPFFASTSSRSAAQSASSTALGGLAAALGQSTLALSCVLESAQILPELAKSAVLEQLGAVLDIYDAARTITRTALSYIEYPLAFMGDLSACQYVAMNTYSMGAGGFRGLNSLSNAFPRLALSAGSSTGSYATGAGAYTQTWASGAQVGQNSAALALPISNVPHVWDAPAPLSAQTVQGAVAAHALVAQTELFVSEVQGVLLAELDTPAMTPQEVESLVGNSRARMQDCMSYARAAYPSADAYAIAEALRTAAEAVQSLGASALNARPPLTRISAPRASNFHLLAYDLYGDYTRAREVLRLNPQVRNPNFIAKGQELYVYAR